MKYSEAKQGRVFVIRLEDGDVVHEVIEAFAQAQAITAATLIAVGGADDGSRLIVGPEQDRAQPVDADMHVKPLKSDHLTIFRAAGKWRNSFFKQLRQIGLTSLRCSLNLSLGPPPGLNRISPGYAIDQQLN